MRIPTNITARILVIALLMSFFSALQAQKIVEVSEPELSLKNGKVLIQFDLLNTTRSEKFTIRVDITVSGGESINARSLDGDVGEGVPGGAKKKITWDIGADSVFLDEDIFVEVYALPEAPPVVVVPPPVEEKKEEVQPEDLSEAKNEEAVAEDTKEPAAEDQGSGKEFSRAGLILQSVALPGLGLTRYTDKPHWIRGALGYGCLGGSIVVNWLAYDSYTAYQTADNAADIDDFFNKAQSRKTTSEILGYAAIGIWVADLVWTFIGTSDLNKKQTAGELKGFSIGTTVEPVSSVPLIALRYRF